MLVGECFKTLSGRPERKAQRKLVEGLSYYKWYESGSAWCTNENAGPLREVDCEIPYWSVKTSP